MVRSICSKRVEKWSGGFYAKSVSSLIKPDRGIHGTIDKWVNHAPDTGVCINQGDPEQLHHKGEAMYILLIDFQWTNRE